MIALGRLAMLAALGLGAACSETGSDDSPFDDLTSEFDSLTDEVSGLPLTDPLTLPIAGSATYDGVMGLSTDGGGGVPTEMVGEMSLTADFTTSRLNGAVDEIVSDRDETLDGTLEITNGLIDRDADLDDEYTYEFDLNGTLTDEDDRDLVVAGEGLGDFFGTDPTHVAGVVDGIVISPTGNASMTAGFAGRD